VRVSGRSGSERGIGVHMVEGGVRLGEERGVFFYFFKKMDARLIFYFIFYIF
jgi:hypothetical protein